MFRLWAISLNLRTWMLAWFAVAAAKAATSASVYD
jgi:hypothetical protein